MANDTRYSYEFRDGEHDGRNVCRIVKHGDYVYLETEGNHDGTVVCTSVRVTRVNFVEGLKHIGGLL
jgi:hypothetical protein